MHRDRLLTRGLGGLFSSRKCAEPQRNYVPPLASCLSSAAADLAILCALLFFFLEKTDSRKGIVSNSLHLTYFGACPAELWVRRGGFFFAHRRRGAKKLWSYRYDFRSPLRLGVFARPFIFFLAETHRPVRRGQAQRKTRLLKTFCIV